MLKKFNIPWSATFSGISLFLSVAAVIISFEQYNIEKVSQDIPFRLAQYQMRVDSYKKLNELARDWVILKNEEYDLSRYFIDLYGLNKLDKAMAIKSAKMAQALSDNTVQFHSKVLVEQVYWPEAHPQFKIFDNTLLKSIECTEYIRFISQDIADNGMNPPKFAELVSKLNGECHVSANYNHSAVLPYKIVVNRIGILVRRHTLPSDK